MSKPHVVVVIPCYKVRHYILDVLKKIGSEVDKILVVDDACPDKTGELVKLKCEDQRVEVLYHEINSGVGGAVKSGYQRAVELGADIVVKLDGDGQMDPEMIPKIIAPLLNGEADYSKGNRFYHLESVQTMPLGRLIGNAALSFLTKISSGYWTIFDPTNGFTALDAKLIRLLPMEKIANGYFFESDLLFRLNLLRAVVADVPMEAFYGDEKSNMNISGQVLPFAYGNTRNFFKRIVYNYFLRDFSLASLQLLFGVGLLLFGGIFGAVKWYGSIQSGVPVTSGTVMLSALPVLVGVQFILSFVSFDMSSIPSHPIQKRL